MESLEKKVLLYYQSLNSIRDCFQGQIETFIDRKTGEQSTKASENSEKFDKFEKIEKSQNFQNLFENEFNLQEDFS